MASTNNRGPTDCFCAVSERMGVEMATEREQLILAAGEGTSVWLGGLGVDFKINGEQTGGALAIVEHPIEPEGWCRRISTMTRTNIPTSSKDGSAPASAMNSSRQVLGRTSSSRASCRIHSGTQGQTQLA
jgi:hypothetical protein